MLPSEHVSTQGILVREQVSTQETLVFQHVSYGGTGVRKHARHVAMWARETRNLADSIKYNS